MCTRPDIVPSKSFDYLHYYTLNSLSLSDWPKVYSEFMKSEPVTSSSWRSHNNHVKDAQGLGNHVIYDHGS